MPKKSPSPAINQTAIGDGNVQAVGDHNTVNVNQTFIQKISNSFAGDTDQQRALRNRRAMLELIKNTWIKGVLEKSLYNEVLIDLGMEERPDAVDHPWDTQIQMPDRSKKTLPPGTSMMQVFTELNGAMLILGEPGSGKTTMLLELARDIIVRAEHDETQSIPVIFNLSSWSNAKQKIDDWLVNELNTKYNVPKKVARKWVENDELQILLDGLDEVKMEQREECVNAINAFRQEHGLTMPIAVCSRINDYEALKTSLNLSGAVLLQPLTFEQINAYIKQGGPELAGIHQALEHDITLRELLKQPLLLSIMILAYRSMPVGIFEHEYTETNEVRRRHLFDTYIQQMFKRGARTKNELYTQEQTKHWLGWLAKLMIRQNQSVFYIELIQPHSLPMYFQQQVVAGGPAILGGLAIGWPIMWFFQSTFGLDIGWLIGMSVGVTFAALLFSNDIKPVQGLSWSWARIIAPLKDEVFVPLSLIILRLKLPRVARRLFPSPLRPLLTVKPILSLLISIAFGSGLVGALVGSFDGWLGGVTGFFYGIFGSLSFTLLATLFLRFLFAPFIGFSRKEVATRAIPNEGIYQSTQSAFLSAIVFGLDVGLVFGLIGSAGGVNGFLVGGSFGLLIGGLAGGLWYGGVVSLQHIILRALLWRNGLAPLEYANFLDHCVNRIFLRKVGGGYIFVHRLLMEHFAAMYSEEEK